MKYLFFISILFASLQSCDQNKKIIAERLSITDSVAINYFRGNGSMDTVIAIKIIRDKKAIEQLAEYISNSSADEQQCGFDGSIHFFRNNLVLQDIDFRMNDAGCMHFRLKINGEWFNTKLSNDAKSFLEKIKAQ
ncbi:MAG: hypothetical protein ABJA78_14060 [Ferruginibacter sp.]